VYIGIFIWQMEHGCIRTMAQVEFVGIMLMTSILLDVRVSLRLGCEGVDPRLVAYVNFNAY
jgi:hypothetical protein